MERSTSYKLRSLSSSKSLLRSGSKSFTSVLSRSGSKCRDWASLAPELFALVLQRVQERGREEKGEGRRVVALAGVCRHWRQLILEQTFEVPLSQTSLLQFPSALTQPGPPHQPLQCIVRRKRGLITLFQSYSLEDLEGLKFLMAARCKWHVGGCAYEITANPKSFSKYAPGYMGRLKSNFWGSHFTLIQCKRENGTDKSRAAKVRTAVAAVHFTEHLLEHGVRQRRISCILSHPCSDPVPVRALCAKRSLISAAFRSCVGGDLDIPRQTQEQVVRSTSRRIMHAPTSDSGLRIKGDDTSVKRLVEKDRLLTDPPPLKLRSKIPAWNEEQQCWSLDFKGRATLSSMHNFQLIFAEDQPVDQEAGTSLLAKQIDQANAGTTSCQEVVVLQVGKIGKGLYTLDFCYPLSAFQALALCLSSFATTVGLAA